jgi:hypothetical protein
MEYKSKVKNVHRRMRLDSARSRGRPQFSSQDIETVELPVITPLQSYPSQVVIPQNTNFLSPEMAVMSEVLRQIKGSSSAMKNIGLRR